ncbi:MAG: S46 family peptidase [Bacteroidia bacterium]
MINILPAFKRYVLCLSFFFLSGKNLSAREGLWLPNLLSELNESDMKSLGMKISAEDIYSVNHESLKDAVVQFGGGCAGGIISNQSLLLTNHHCGFSQIQSLSSIEKNYLQDGFWAKSLNEEIPCPGLTVTFIIRIENVSSQILSFLSDTLSEEQRKTIVKNLSDSLEAKTVKGTHYKAIIKSFFSGNEYYLFVTEVFKDIRFVGAPPLALGKYGGETDNWTWPRHESDFSVFRIYANKENQPADYSTENVPFHPRKFFSINDSGIKQDDFTLVMGFPGKTSEYIPSAALEMICSQTNPNKVKIREERLKIWNEEMIANDTVFLQYSSKYKTLANYYKKWKGEVEGLKKFKAVQIKKQFEREFTSWVSEKEERKSEYGQLLNNFDLQYEKGKSFSLLNDYVSEAMLGIELVNYVAAYRTLVESSHKDVRDEKLIQELADKLRLNYASAMKNYSAKVDERNCSEMLRLCYRNLPDSLCPDFLKRIYSEYNGSFQEYSHKLFSKSIFLQKEKLSELLSNFDLAKCKKLERDPAWKFMQDIFAFQKNKVQSGYDEFIKETNTLQRKFMKGIMEFSASKILYPDANLTLRVSYGKVEGLRPADGIEYTFQTTLDGLIEKEGKNKEEFIVPTRLKELFVKKDYGDYGENGTVPVNFLASNHTSGGNSGSPVINAKGQLIGLNFDRISEGIMSDYVYNPDLSRNIVVDIRFILFVIDKYGGCRRLIDEMKIVKE